MFNFLTRGQSLARAALSSGDMSSFKQRWSSSRKSELLAYKIMKVMHDYEWLCLSPSCLLFSSQFCASSPSPLGTSQLFLERSCQELWSPDPECLPPVQSQSPSSSPAASCLFSSLMSKVFFPSAEILSLLLAGSLGCVSTVSFRRVMISVFSNQSLV